MDHPRWILGMNRTRRTLLLPHARPPSRVSSSAASAAREIHRFESYGVIHGADAPWLDCRDVPGNERNEYGSEIPLLLGLVPAASSSAALTVKGVDRWNPKRWSGALALLQCSRIRGSGLAGLTLIQLNGRFIRKISIMLRKRAMQLRCCRRLRFRIV